MDLIQHIPADGLDQRLPVRLTQACDWLVHSFLAEGTLGGGQDRLLERLDQHGPVDVLVFGYLVEDQPQGGSITIAHGGRYGSLAGKAVSLEVSTGYAFDTPMEPRQH